MVFTRSASKRRLDDMSDESFEDSDTSVIKRISTNSPSSQPPNVHLVPNIHATSPVASTVPPSHSYPNILQPHHKILPPPKPSMLGSNVAFASPLTPLVHPQREGSPLASSAPPHRLPHPIPHHHHQHLNSSRGLLNTAIYLEDMPLSRVVNETPSTRATSIADLVSPTNHNGNGPSLLDLVSPTPLTNATKNSPSHSQFSIRHRNPRTTRARGSRDNEPNVDSPYQDGYGDEEGDNGGDEGDEDDDEEDEVDTERDESPMSAAKALTHIIKPKKRKYTTNKNEIKINKRVMASDTPEVIKMFKKFDNEVLSNEEARNKLLVLGFETRKRYITTIKHYIRFCVSKGLQEFLVTGELMKEFYEQQFSISGSDNPIIRLRKMDPAFSKLQEINNIAYKLNSKHIPNRYIALEFLISKENASGVDSTSLSDDGAIKRRPVLEHSVSNIEIMRSSSTPPVAASARATRSAFDVRGVTQIPPPITPLKRESSKVQVLIPETIITSASAPVTPASPAPSTSPVSTKETSRAKRSRKTSTSKSPSFKSSSAQKKKAKLTKLDNDFMTTVNKAVTEINLAISNKHKFINQEIDSLFLNKRLKASDRLDFKLNMNNKLLAMKFEIDDYISGLKDNLRLRQERSGLDHPEVKIESLGEAETDSEFDEELDNAKPDLLEDEMEGLNDDDDDYEDTDEEDRKNTKKIAMNNEIFTIYEILEEWYVIEPTIEFRLKNYKLNWVKDEIDLHIFNERKLIIDFIERLSVEFDEDRFLSANHCDRFIREKLILDEFISEIELDSVDLFKRIVRYRQGN